MAGSNGEVGAGVATEEVNPAGAELGFARTEVERRLQAANLPQMVADSLAQRIVDLASESGQSSVDRDARIAEVMQNIGAVVDDVVDRVVALANHAPHAVVGARANNHNRRRNAAAIGKGGDPLDLPYGC